MARTAPSSAGARLAQVISIVCLPPLMAIATIVALVARHRRPRRSGAGGPRLYDLRRRHPLRLRGVPAAGQDRRGPRPVPARGASAPLSGGGASNILGLLALVLLSAPQTVSLLLLAYATNSCSWPPSPSAGRSPPTAGRRCPDRLDQRLRRRRPAPGRDRARGLLGARAGQMHTVAQVARRGLAGVLHDLGRAGHPGPSLRGQRGGRASQASAWTRKALPGSARRTGTPPSTAWCSATRTPVYTLCFRLTGNAEDAQMRAGGLPLRLPQPEVPQGLFRSWLFRIASNCSYLPPPPPAIRPRSTISPRESDDGGDARPWTCLIPGRARKRPPCAGSWRR